MKIKNKPKKIDLTIQDAEKLQQRLLNNSLTNEDKEILIGMMSFNFWLHEQLASAKLRIGRLKRLFGFRGEKKRPKVPIL